MDNDIPRQVNWFWPALGLLFITLKLCGAIDWHWVWVLLPFWAPLAVVTFWVGVVSLAWLVYCTFVDR